MHKLFSFLCLSVIVFMSGIGCCNHVIKSADAIRAEKVSGLTVALVHTYRGHTGIYCSGVWVSGQDILTANHCIKALSERYGVEKLVDSGMDSDVVAEGVALGMIELPEVDIMSMKVEYIVESENAGFEENPTSVHSAKVIALDASHDLGIVQSAGIAVKHDIAVVGSSSPLVGESIYVSGHPLGLYWSYFNGIVSGYRASLGEKTDTMGPFLQIQAPINHGNSGGGVFNSGGELVGIALLGPANANIGFCAELDTIRGFLIGERLLKGKIGIKKVDPKL